MCTLAAQVRQRAKRWGVCLCGVKLLLGEAGKEQETGITGAKARTEMMK